MAATRASGTNAVRYGTIRDAVMGLEVVLPNAQLIRTGGQAKKSAAGYDLTRLMIGSEGTLGIMTELTIRLHGIPEVIAGGICSFNSIGDACRAVATTIQSGIPVARIELLDTMQVRACNGYSGYDFLKRRYCCLSFTGRHNRLTSNQMRLPPLLKPRGQESLFGQAIRMSAINYGKCAMTLIGPLCRSFPAAKV